MSRAALVLVAGYGVRLSYRASRNIADMGKAAARGDLDAQQHFTQTRYARLLGPRNSDLGIVFYGAVTVAAGTGTIQRGDVRTVLLLGSTASVAMSVYLLWALMFRLRVLCPICLQGHALNLLVLLLLLRQGRQH